MIRRSNATDNNGKKSCDQLPNDVASIPELDTCLLSLLMIDFE